MMRTLFADLRYAVRAMFRTPSFAFAVISVLALGIGANTAIFSIVNAVLLRPLPFEEPERLVRVFSVPPGGTATLPGVILCGIGLLGLLALPSKISKMKSQQSGRGRVALVIAIDLGFVIAGLVMLSVAHS